MLVDPRSVAEIAEAMTRVAEDSHLREQLSERGLKRASDFSWKRTAEMTMEAYAEIHTPPQLRRGGAKRRGGAGQTNDFIDQHHPSLGYASAVPSSAEEGNCIRAAIHKTIDYAKLFQYPLHPDELHDRLFDVEVDRSTFQQVLDSLHLESDPTLLTTRTQREAISDTAIHEALPHLHTLASMPFIRMIAFSGATAHRNMTSTDDVDLFIIVEDGKLWAVFLLAMLWAKMKGLRKRLCMNYLISDAALPLAETDAFTAQQAASLKPIFGKGVYDRFHEMN